MFATQARDHRSELYLKAVIHIVSDTWIELHIVAAKEGPWQLECGFGLWWYVIVQS